MSVFPGQVAVVVGLGVAGLLHLQLLLARGLRTVIGVSRSPAKLQLATKLGAAVVVSPDQAHEAVADVTHGDGADLVVESAGTVDTLRQSVELAGMAATVLLFGTITDHNGELPFYQLYFKELDIRSTRAARPGDYANAIHLVGSGAVRLADLVTSSFPLSDIAAALVACERDPEQLKVTLDIS
ncbi:MAG: zinc-binding dehydrogenase [Nocardioidaceae bacterium]